MQPIQWAPMIALRLNPAPTIPEAVAAEIAIVRTGTNQVCFTGAAWP